MKISKFAKVHRDVLFEYVYNDGNLISEQYKILVNIKDGINSFISTDTSGTNNTKGNQLFRIDPVSGKYGKVDTNYYSFLQEKDYSAGIPVRHDTIKLHLPINYTFGEYIGCYIKAYTYGYDNRNTFELTNFYFDMTDVSQSYLLNYTSPPLLFQEKLWGKNIQIEIPSVSEIATQRVNGRAKENSINSNLTNGLGLSLTSPIFIDFYFITKSQTLNGITTYLMSPKTTVTVPQTPEFEQLGLKIEHSVNGDFFEIYGTYNNSLAELKTFIENSVTLGNKYYIQYTITMYEQNIRGKSLTITVNDNFNEKIEYRPIIKYSTTTAIIDVEMKLIDAVDESYVVRKASYGMLQDEVSKYSLNLSKINLRNAMKPKIYNTRTTGSATFGDANTGVGAGFVSDVSNITLQTVKIPFPVMVDKSNVIGKSDNVVYNKDKFYGIGKLLINIFPFDNIINFVIALNTTDSSDTTATSIQYLDMSSMNDIQLEFKNSTTEVKVPIYREAENNLSIGQVVFKIPKNKIPEIRKIYDSNNNIFYITTTSGEITTVIYTGLFKMYDSSGNITELNQNLPTLNAAASNPKIIQDNSDIKEKAIVTRRIVSKQDDKVIPPKKIDSNISVNVSNLNIRRNNIK
jgi:hypothetical protein